MDGFLLSIIILASVVSGFLAGWDIGRRIMVGQIEEYLCRKYGADWPKKL
jgi:hypothetical protein